MITLAVWVLALAALGVAAHFFGVDSRDVDYTARVVPGPVPAATELPHAIRVAQPIG